MIKILNWLENDTNFIISLLIILGWFILNLLIMM